MLRELLVLALTGFCLAQAIGSETHTADMDFLHKQKKIYELFFYIDQPKLIGSEFYEVGRSYDIEQNIDLYKDKMIPREFLYRFKLGMLKRGALFSVYYKEHREELRILFKLFYYAKDFTTFYKTACWARLYMNEGMFIMAFTTAVMYRPDCKNIALPPMYEVYPHLFFNNEIIQDAHRIKMTAGYKKELGVGNTETFLINTNYTTSFMKYFADKEYELDYFYDDVGLNNYYYYVRNIFPFWISLKDLEVPKQIRGELYYYVHQQLMARYYLERLSNGLGEIEDFDFYNKFAPGYFSTIVYGNGVAQPSRERYSEVPYYKFKYVKEIQNIEYRILAAIDAGYIVDKEGKQYGLYTKEGLNYLGNLIEGNYDSCNTRFYGAIDVLYRDIFGFNYDCKHKNCVVPSALQLFSTSLRDPAFYRLYKKIIGYFFRYKCNLPAYTKNDLEFSGVYIEDVKLDKLYTFFEEYDYLINNAVTVDNYKDGMNFNIKARKYRLNYKPFTYTIDVKSERPTKGMVRIFMGPSYNDKFFKKQNYFYYSWYNFVELDEFMVDLKTGMNTIERSSKDSSFTGKDFLGGDKFYKKLIKAVEGNEPFTYSNKLYGFPSNLYLPRGRVGGYPFKLFVFIYPVDEANLTTFTFPLFGKILYDGKPFGFPLDRPMYPWYYDLKNMYFRDVYVHYLNENTESYQKEHYGQYISDKYETYGQYPKYDKYEKYDKYDKYYGKEAYPIGVEKTLFCRSLGSRMRRILVVWATVCLALVGAVHKDTYTADKVYLTKQKRVYELFWHIDQPTTVHPEFYQIARAWNLEDHVDAYPHHQHVVQEFVQRWKYGLLPREAVFTSYHPEHVEEVKALFNLFYHAKDFETFYNMAIWARFHVNAHLYAYTLAVAILHRPDTRNIRLPVLHEMIPHFYFNNEVLQTAYRAKLGDANLKKSVDVKYHDGTDLVIHANYSGWYIVHDDADEKLTYFTEDVGINDWYFHAVHDYPSWISSDNCSLTKEIRGEVYYTVHRQLLARYYMERLSNNLGEIETIDWHSPIVTGYYPTINLPNGLPFVQRPSWTHIPQYMNELVNHLEQVEARIRTAIASGYITDNSRPPKNIDIYTPEGFNLLGNIIEGNMDSVNLQLYGSVDALARQILGFSPQPIDKNHVVPSVLDYTATSMRDPAFYRIYKKIVSYFVQYKQNLPKYTHEEVVFPGVKVDSVAVDKLITYFENFDSVINNGIPVSSVKDATTSVIKVRQPRLNHKPFTYHISVTSDKDVKGTVRIFLGPKFDVHGHEIDFVDQWLNFVELDQFVVDLKSGANKIKRSSSESIYFMPDEVSTTIYWKKMVNALETGEVFQYNGQVSGFPDRLALPKGKKEGLPLKLFVHVSPFQDDQAVTIKSPIWGITVVDGKPMGFPLDRPVVRHLFHGVPNAHFKDVVVFHKQIEELNQTGQTLYL
ncbi:uncharacterized protein [Fopius arisanus]|uniref:Uncharacterized protein n=4 Tax=Fopius arisanus TaxID=64838 RepID=A0A9R1U167_9HYME|nr:PREDICTED: uncharacterized protein LOC105267857 [Fopius arisanus]